MTATIAATARGGVMATIRCVSCTAKVDETTVVCPECGEDARTGGTPRTCKECGAAVPREAISCRACGAHVPVKMPEERTAVPVGAGSTLTIRRARARVDGPWQRAYAVLLDGEEIGKVKPSRSLTVTVSPGPHTLALRFGGLSSEKELEFDAESDRDLAFECGYGIDKGDIAAGIIFGAVEALLLGGGASVVGTLWVRRATEPSEDDTQSEEAGPRFR